MCSCVFIQQYTDWMISAGQNRQSNWIREHSLMTLLRLVDNVMINVLSTWRRNLSFWSSVFILNTNESWVRWPMFSVAIWAITGNFCFNVTYRFCHGVSRIMPIMILDYYQKPASVHAFYKPFSFKVSVFCFVSRLGVFARLSRLLSVRMCDKMTGSPSVNSALAFNDRKRGPVVSSPGLPHPRLPGGNSQCLWILWK